MKMNRRDKNFGFKLGVMLVLTQIAVMLSSNIFELIMVNISFIIGMLIITFKDGE